jgi:alpha-ribazole phosphatase
VPLRLDPRLMEYGFGAWQGADVARLASEQGDALAAFWADPEANPPPDAEPFAAFRARLTEALDDIARVHAVAQRVLVVTHGGPVRLLRCLVAGTGSRGMANMDVPHASLHRLEWPPVRGLPGDAGERNRAP